MTQDISRSLLRIGLPKGRIQEGVFRLLEEAGIPIQLGSRAYRPTLALPGWEAKLLKPQNIIEMLQSGSRDLGFAGRDWALELRVDAVELLDTGLDPVRLVAAAPESLLENGRLPARPLVVASEYRNIALDWIRTRGLDARFLLSRGATEVFPPEDADCIIDNTATGSTLRANQLAIVDEILLSTTRLYADPRALDVREKRQAIEDFVVLVRAVLEARHRVMIEVNVQAACLDAVAACLPCMRTPTISPLHAGLGYAVKAAVPRRELPRLIPEIRAKGGSDIVVTPFSQIIP